MFKLFLDSILKKIGNCFVIETKIGKKLNREFSQV